MSIKNIDFNTEAELKRLSALSEQKLSTKDPITNKSKEDLAPPDKYHLVHIIFFFLGVGAVVPSAFFLVAQDYWMFKFRDINYDYVDLKNKTILQKNFVSISGLSRTFPAILTTILSSYYGHKINIHSRLVGCMSSLCITYVISIAFININTDSWQLGFFVLTMAFSVAITVACHLHGVTMFPLISRFPLTYMKTQMYGTAFAGLLSALLQIFCLWLSGESTTVAIIYFSCGTFILVMCTTCAIACKYVPRFSYYLGDTVADTSRPNLSFQEMKVLMIKLWPKIILIITSLLTSGMSGSNITTLVVSEYYEQGGDWAKKYFEPVITFLWPDIMGLIGRYLARPLMTRTNAPYFVLIDCLRILAFNPLFLFCNAQPRKHIPVLLPHDWEYFLVITISSLTGHFFDSSSFMSMENLVPEQTEQGYLLMASFGGIVGIFSSTLGTLWVNVL